MIATPTRLMGPSDLDRLMLATAARMAATVAGG